MEDNSRARSVSPTQCAVNLCICGRATDNKTLHQSPLAFLYENKQCADMIIRLSDNKEFPAHMIILSTWSHYFATMLLGNGQSFKEGQTKTLLIDKFAPSIVRICIKALYSLPKYVNGTIPTQEAFNAFDFALAYSIIPIQNICVAEITRFLAEMGNSMQITDGTKYVEIVRDVFNRWIPLYDELRCPQETLEILGELVSQVMRTVRDNINSWMLSGLVSTFLNGLSTHAMAFLLNYDGLEIEEVTLISLYVVWIKYRYGSFTKNEKGEMIAIPNEDMEAKDDEVSLLHSIRWGNISQEDIRKLYNSFYLKNADNACLPKKVLSTCENIMLEALLHKSGQAVESRFPCANASQRRRSNQSPRKKPGKRPRVTED